MTDPVQVIRDDERAGVLLDPLRRRMLTLLAEPDSATGVARQLELPRQKVNYHLRQLEARGLVELVEERRKGNCIERIVRATARSYVISPEVLGALGGDAETVRDRFSAGYLVAAAARIIRELAELRERAAAAGKRLATLTLETEIRFASAEDRNAFAEELTTEVARLTAKYHDEDAPDGRRFRFVVGGLPVLDETNDVAVADVPADSGSASGTADSGTPNDPDGSDADR